MKGCWFYNGVFKFCYIFFNIGYYVDVIVSRDGNRKNCCSGDIDF